MPSTNFIGWVLGDADYELERDLHTRSLWERVLRINTIGE